MKEEYDRVDQNLKHSVIKEEQGTLQEPCRLKSMEKSLTDQKEYENTPVEKRNKELHVNLGVCKAMNDENNGREVHASTPVETRCTRNDNEQLR